MLTTLGYICFGIYTFCMIYIAMYCLVQLNLLVYFFRRTRESSCEKTLSNVPAVTIQLPIFNERYVVERLIDSVVLINYPNHKLEIQVLDDSTDDTTEIIKEKVTEYQSLGHDIKIIHRSDREGFKAGALRNGLLQAKGEFIAIFDADFIPRTDFLLNTMCHFENERIGVVQTRWSHLNQTYSLLTELQAFQLNVHFTVEQAGRSFGELFLQFNGTAGVWRKTTIEDAGGWEADTLTEDLDLSYRAQLKHWQIKYMMDITSPAELPVEISGLKSQQYRWMKGGAENAKSLLKPVWNSDFNVFKKIHASMHLLASSVYLFIFLLGIVSLPLLLLLEYTAIDMKFFSIFLANMLAIVLVYFVGNVIIAWPKENIIFRIVKFLFIFPLFLSLSMGLSLHNALAVISGWFGKKSEFVRTPKYGITTLKSNFTKSKYFKNKIGAIGMLEGLLAIYFAVGLYLGLQYGVNYFTILHALLMVGYFSIFSYTLLHSKR